MDEGPSADKSKIKMCVLTVINLDLRPRVVKLRDHRIGSTITNVIDAGKRDNNCKIVLWRCIALNEPLYIYTETEDIVGTCGAGSLVASEINEEQMVTTIEDCIGYNHMLLANIKSINMVINTYQISSKGPRNRCQQQQDLRDTIRGRLYVTLGAALWWWEKVC